MKDWELMLLEWYCEDMFDQNGPSVLTPALDARLSGWALKGHLIANDAILRRRATIALAPVDLFYGVLIENAAHEQLVLVRGTATFAEWIEDGEFLPQAHPVVGEVEQGFYGLYRTLRFRALDGTTVPAASGLTVEGRDAQSVTVVGHSLGAALATYLMTELAQTNRLGRKVHGRFVASPRPGDGLFGKWAVQQLGVNWTGYAYEFDHVPRVPLFFGYAPLPGTLDMMAATAKARVRITPVCSHHVVCYAALAGGKDAYDAAKASSPADKQFMNCILGVEDGAGQWFNLS